MRKIKPVEYIEGNGLGYCEGAIIKYATRWKDKSGGFVISPKVFVFISKFTNGRSDFKFSVVALDAWDAMDLAESFVRGIDDEFPLDHKADADLIECLQYVNG